MSAKAKGKTNRKRKNQKGKFKITVSIVPARDEKGNITSAVLHIVSDWPGAFHRIKIKSENFYIAGAILYTYLQEDEAIRALLNYALMVYQIEPMPSNVVRQFVLENYEEEE